MRFREYGNHKDWIELQPTLEAIYDHLRSIYMGVFRPLAPTNVYQVNVLPLVPERGIWLVTTRGRASGYIDGPLLDYQI